MNSDALALTLFLGACAPSCVGAPSARSPGGLEFSHDNSIAQRWPYGLDQVTTKIVAEPSDKDATAASYWLVRTQSRSGGSELVAELSVEPESRASEFAPVTGVDYRIIVGSDARGATTRELRPGLFEVRTHAAGFALRAEFLGDSDGPEPPKALLVRILRVVESSSGAELALGPRSLARWLIVDPD